MDWATQPDPFRMFDGAEKLFLDVVPPGDDPAYDALFQPGSVPPAAVDQRSISQLFFDSLALSAWKSIQGSRWPLRVNPSSGNLHPTEGYLIAGPVSGLNDRPAVYHYTPFHHALEVRSALRPEAWEPLAAALPGDAFLVGFTSIHWRESWKYGERAFRYCHLDVGHAVAAMAAAAAALGWEATLLAGVSDSEMGVLLGAAGQTGMEAEHPDCLLLLHPGAGTGTPGPRPSLRIPTPVLTMLQENPWHGTPNILSRGHHAWPVIDEVSEAAFLDEAAQEEAFTPVPADSPPSRRGVRPLSGRGIIRQRRSAMAMDGKTAIPRDTFFHILERTVPALNPVLFNTLPWKPCIHLVLFVHRVEGLASGLYLLVRNPADRDAIRAAVEGDFRWTAPEGCPEHLHLALLEEKDCQDISNIISCSQDIASDGAFALGMLAGFEPEIRSRGAWFYKRLYWEAGAIGQILYLEAEAAGVRATGIGCFLDDVMHRLLGLRDRTFQSLYHLTVGGPVSDPRLRTEVPYQDRETSG